MKINVLINENDFYFREGIEFMLKEVVQQDHSTHVVINHDYILESINNADVIVLSLSPGEQFVCTPELLKRSSGALIGIVGRSLPSGSGITACLNGIYFISRNATVSSMRQVLREAILSSNSEITRRNCLNCRRKTLTSRQHFIIEGLVNGESVETLARSLSISKKSIYAHKYFVMQKFNLHNDHELLTFTYNLVNKKRCVTREGSGLLRIYISD